MSLNDPEAVARQYATEAGLAARRDIGTVRDYFGSSERLAPAIERLPGSLEQPLVARRTPVVFVARKAA